MSRKILLLLFFFILIQVPLWFSVLPSDDNVYYVVAREVSEGANLYSKIFLAHPPLHIIPYIILIKIFGVNLVVFKGFTTLVALGSAYFVYKIAKEKYGEKAAFISLFLFLTSYDMLIFSSFSFGIELSVLFFLASLYYLNKNNYVSGLFYALCIMTRLHLGFLGLPLFLYSKEKRKFLLGASISLIYYALLIQIPNFLSNVFGYHAIKTRFWGGWVSYFKANIHLFLLFLFSIKWIKDIKLVFIAIIYCLSMLLVASVFEYFFILVTVVLCIEGSQCMLYSRYKNTCRFVAVFWVIMLLSKSMPFMLEQTKAYDELVDFTDTLEDKPIVGQSAITALLALKTGREIHLNQIDTNFQRRAVYDYTTAIVIYETLRFSGIDFGCELIEVKKVVGKEYGFWYC